MARQRVRKTTTTKRKVRKSKSVARIKKDGKGKSHCSRCGAYISK